MEQEWTKPRPDYWCFGTQEMGGGVYPEKGKWHGAALYCTQVRKVGPFGTLEEAKRAVETEYAKLMMAYN